MCLYYMYTCTLWETPLYSLLESPRTFVQIGNKKIDVYICQVIAEGRSSVVIRLVDEGQSIKLATPQAESIVKELNSTISRWQNQQPVSNAHYLVFPTLF